jgi:hypothetical protein
MINLFPKISMKNRRLIESSSMVGCYHCCKLFHPKEIKEYTDNDETCICPYCSIDCIVGDKCGFILEEEILKKANKYWFN